MLMAISTLFLASMQASVRHLGQDVNSIQITFVSSVVGLLCLSVLSTITKQSLFHSTRKKVLIVRGFLVAIGNLVYFFALSLTPLVEATSLSFTGIIFAIILSVVFLRESMYFHRWVGIIVAFTGVVAILRPGYIDASLGAYAVLFASLTWGLALFVSKVLARTEAPSVILAWSLLITACVSGICVIPIWVPVMFEQSVHMILVGVLWTVGHFCMTKSLKMYDATVVLPVNCTRLVWAAIIGVVIFQEIPDWWTIIGSILIASAVIYLSRSEGRSIEA